MAFSNSATHVFVSPPAAPTFVPTEEEFRDPLAYLEKIRPVAENYGVIKIKPPPNWQPPFMIDVDEKEFEPRVQKLNELDGLSRVRLNFVDRIAKFWNLQGIVLRIPVIEGKALDLHRLHQVSHANLKPSFNGESK
ncbi:unnamed protein product [Soboliphyme baturini]|uniref:JmjN domain-containing protein n=1 Tax=Soboliphyme baturini TaxID=241478 RepID=A0A183IKG6_9BILA|nr:unnamed protein product [Soboliphyme baturini]